MTETTGFDILSQNGSLSDLGVIIVDKNQISTRSKQIIAAVNHLLTGRTTPLVMSLDGGSGAGKSTLAAELASVLEAAVISCDDFFDASISDEEWDTCTAEQKCLRCIDWERLRKEALTPLIAGREARYHPFSFTSGNGVAASLVTKNPAPVIILDGIYSSLPVLSDVVHFTVLVDVTPEIRRERHNLREGSSDAAWHLRWDSAEDYYFSTIRPPALFDLVVTNQ
ncbi:uridine kinase family protein [Paenibacillus nasutitermitis]|uniref:Uridine kinase n=1 Tax=Paenibacillus nasutitermitis TaxID=1652958 RepID=A0A916YT76_9BACL|nr:hypothetical protein [Paenibacillus nasutitermitis]GGD58905.1 uridine kinase [Paenibacillus nasutitermitis]